MKPKQIIAYIILTLLLPIMLCAMIPYDYSKVPINELIMGYLYMLGAILTMGFITLLVIWCMKQIEIKN